MVSFEKHTLANGLRVIAHRDTQSEIAALNLLYDVGARDEHPGKTGFAHLFEHLMFGGSVNIPDYDRPLQEVGGENNAFTSNDITNYYLTLPAANLETGYWLESDRMLELAFSPKSLEVQRQVVIEEFKQRYLNQPYGDVWLLFRPLCYKDHPYQWPTIGKDISHIEQATMEDVKAFFYQHYRPQNAVLTVAGNVDSDRVFSLAEKWFGSIERPGNGSTRDLPMEKPQTEYRRLEVERDVPVSMFYLAFHMDDRKSQGYYDCDLLSDILARGKSSRLYQQLVVGKKLFSEIGAYITGSDHPGLFVVSGKLAPGVSFEAAEAGIWEELDRIAATPVLPLELEKVQNKVESGLIFSRLNALNKAMALCNFELGGDANGFNHEVDRYREVTDDRVRAKAQQLFRRENASALVYRSKSHAQ